MQSSGIVKTPAASLEALLSIQPDNSAVYKSVMVTWQKLHDPSYKKVVCAISGGSDSDVLLDLVFSCDTEKKVEYVWFDTGIEYRATKEHLSYLESKYGITIRRIKAHKPIPVSCKEFGQPFLSKRVSEYMERLQSHGFCWEDEDISVLRDRYCTKATGTEKERLDRIRAEKEVDFIQPWAYRDGNWYTGCVSALEWWCNCSVNCGDNNLCNIRNNKWLREFIISNPPTFRIANKCCKYAKKDMSHEYIKELSKDGLVLNIYGVRKAEGGIRSTAYKNCFTSHSSDGNHDDYRAIFWYTQEDKEAYEKAHEICHSRCYGEYGLSRTGCVGCPCGRNPKAELEVTRANEPLLYKAVTNIFGDSYAYLDQYLDFCRKMEDQCRNDKLLSVLLSDFFEIV